MFKRFKRKKKIERRLASLEASVKNLEEVQQVLWLSDEKFRQELSKRRQQKWVVQESQVKFGASAKYKLKSEGK